MGNIKNFNFNKLDLKLSNSDYWDFYLANDEYNSPDCNSLVSGSCFVVWYDFNNTNTFIDNPKTISSLVYWTGGTNTGYTLNTFGLTGIDNGLITFDKLSGDTTNQALLSALTGTTLVIPSGDTRLTMNLVSGTTGNLNYDVNIIQDINVGGYAQFNGGFYQGFYKLDGYSYQVLPDRYNQAWSAEFWLKPSNLISSGNTLNDLYPNNKGMFFYMGTRAENKFWNEWLGSDTGCTSGCTVVSGCSDSISEWCTIPKENDIILIGDYGIGIPLDPPRVEIDLITNQFLIYGRGRGQTSARYTGDSGNIIIKHNDNAINCLCSSCVGPLDGLGSRTPCTYDGKGIGVARTREIITNNTNPFLIYGRASKYSGSTGYCGGSNDGFGTETICSFSGVSSPEKTIDYNLDIIDNAIGFRIKDDGSIGYRLLTVTGTCIGETYISGVTIEEKYSEPNLIPFSAWTYIVIKFVTDYKDDCDLKVIKPRKGKLMFYFNGLLKFVVNDFTEFISKRLDEYKDKQIGVPFNISLGGGSQGLIESQTFGGLDDNDRGLPIEENFGGSFIGGISQFRFNICDLSLCQIRNYYDNEKIKYL